MVLPGEQFSTITEADAIELLRRDLAIAEAAVRRLISVTLTQSQFDALVSFTFNLQRRRRRTGEVHAAAADQPMALVERSP